MKKIGAKELLDASPVSVGEVDISTKKTSNSAPIFFDTDSGNVRGYKSVVLFDGSLKSIATLVWATKNFREVMLLMYETANNPNTIFIGEVIADILKVKDVKILFLTDTDLGYYVDSDEYKHTNISIALSVLLDTRVNHLVIGLRGIDLDTLKRYEQVFPSHKSVHIYSPMTNSDYPDLDEEKKWVADYVVPTQYLLNSGYEGILKFAEICSRNCGECDSCHIREKLEKKYNIKLPR